MCYNVIADAKQPATPARPTKTLASARGNTSSLAGMPVRIRTRALKTAAAAAVAGAGAGEGAGGAGGGGGGGGGGGAMAGITNRHGPASQAGTPWARSPA